VATRKHLPRLHRRVLDWTEVFAADLRSLAALRVVLALTVLADLFERATNLRVHYTAEGILPRRILIDQIDHWQFSLALMNDTRFFQALLFAVAAVAALAMLIGYRTRLMTFVVWVLILSIQVRNPFVNSSADDLLRILLFWSMFLPLGTWWSVDYMRGTATQPPSLRVLSMATAGLFLQIAFVYWFTLWLKSGPEWRVNGTALYYALSIEELASPLGTYVLQFSTLLKVLTFGTLGVELGATLLLFCPVFTGPVRTAAVMAIIALHAGIWLTMSIGFFPWLAASCMVCFLPSWFWDTLIPRLRTAFPKFSNAAFATGQAATGVAQAFQATLWPRLMSLGSAGQFSITAVPAITRRGRTDGASPIPTTPSVGRTPADAHTKLRMNRSSFFLNLVTGFFLVYVFVWNLTTVSAVTITEDARALGRFLGLAQYWTMFAPYPTNGSTWFIIPGTLRDGREIDLLPALLHDDPNLLPEVDWEKPRNLRSYFNGEERWRKYFEVLSGDHYPDLLLPFGQYICINWNNAHQDSPLELEAFDINYYWQPTLEDYHLGSPQQTVLWTHDCYPGSP